MHFKKTGKMNKPNREMFQYAITKVFISQGRDVTLHYMTPTISIAMLLGNVKAAYDIHVYVQIHTQFWDSNHALPRSRLNFDLKTQKRMEMDKMYAAYCLTLYCASNLLSVFCEVQTMRIWDDQPQKVRPQQPWEAEIAQSLHNSWSADFCKLSG